jgi:hypothetical protein
LKRKTIKKIKMLKELKVGVPHLNDKKLLPVD